MIRIPLKQLNQELRTALVAAGFEPRRRETGAPLVWSITQGETISNFSPRVSSHAWGFMVRARVGLEVSTLSIWLNERASPEEQGILFGDLVSYRVPSLSIDGDPSVAKGPFIEKWLAELRQTMTSWPTSSAVLLQAYLQEPEQLGELAASHNRPAWDFFQAWMANPEVDLKIPQPDLSVLDS